MEKLQNMPFNSKIVGAENVYYCWETKYSQARKMSGPPCICIASYVTLPKNYHFHRIAFSDPQEFSKEKFNRIIYSFFFIPVEDLDNAMDIIKDILAVWG